jgi:hypothetical protein
VALRSQRCRAMGVVLLLVALPGVVTLALVSTFGGMAALVMTMITVGLVAGVLAMARDWDSGDVDGRLPSSRDRGHLRDA